MHHAALLVLFAPCLFAADLLRNPSFEEAKDGRPVAWTTGHKWFAKPKGSGLAKVELDTTLCQGPGRSCLRITGSKNRGIAQQALVARPEWGKRLRLSGWMRLQDTGTACARIDVECRDKAGKYLGGFASLVTDWRQSTADWQRYEKVFELPEDAHMVRVHCSSDRANSGIMWFDNLALEPVAPPSQASSSRCTQSHPRRRTPHPPR